MFVSILFVHFTSYCVGIVSFGEDCVCVCVCGLVRRLTARANLLCPSLFLMSLYPVKTGNCLKASVTVVNSIVFKYNGYELQMCSNFRINVIV